MQEEILLRSILLELQYIPAEYLRLLFEIIHAFRVNLPNTVHNAENFDWEVLSDEIMANRRRNNEQMFRRVNQILAD